MIHYAVNSFYNSYKNSINLNVNN
ncbi:hypothetical protein IFVP408_C2120037 [Vibrio parahaemolyticus]